MKSVPGLIALALLCGCGASSSPSATGGTATYSISGTELMVFDSVSYSDGSGQLITGVAPLDGWHRSVSFPLPGEVEAHLHVVALGAGRAVLRVSWTADGVTHRDSTVAQPATAEILVLSIPSHVVGAP